MAVVTVGQITITDVNDGLNAILTQESYSVSTDANGSGGDYSGASTTLNVKIGSTDDTPSWTVSALASPGVIGTLTGGTFKVDSMVVDTGYVDLTATKAGNVALTARFNITKVKQGVVGPGLTLTSSAAGFTFTDGVALPSTQIISVKALRQNFTDPLLFYASNGTTVLTDAGIMTPEGAAFGIPLVGAGDVCYISLADFGLADQMYVTAVCGDATAVLNLAKINYSTAAAGATRNIFRGDWTVGSTYAMGDTVLAGGSSWTPLVQHIATLGNAPPALPATSNVYWTQYAAKGDRGTIQTAVATAGTSWSDSAANAAIVAAGGVAAQRGDVVTLYNSSISFSQTRVFTTGGTWAALAAFFGGDVLVDGTVVTNKLAAEAVTTDKLAARAVTANELDAESVTASKMLISAGGNVYPDYNLIDPDFYASSTAAGYAFVGTTSSLLGRRWLNVPPAGGVDQKVETGWFFLEPDTEYFIDGAAWAGAAGARAVLEFETASTDLYGNPATSLGLTTIQDATGVFGPASFAGVAVITGPLARKARFVMTRVAAYGGTGGAGFGAMSVIRKATGELIVDGTIKGTHIAAEEIDATHILAKSINTDHIDVTGIEADKLNINGLLTLNELTAGFALGKESANDFDNDGLYMGRTAKANGDIGFGLLMGKTEANGKKTYLQHTSDAGFKIVNANYGLLTDLTSTPVQYTTSQTVTLNTLIKTLNLSVVGGGAGGWGSGGQNAGTGGGDTVVQLYDGTTYTGTSWTGAGAPITGAVGGNGGDGGSFGVGGSSARRVRNTGTHSTGETYYYYTTAAATNATPYGSGGGGGCTNAQTNGGGFKGGAAAPALLITGYDIGALGLTAPKLVITIGAGGVKNSSGSGYGAYGTDGTQGMVRVDQILSDIVPCGVVPFYPTATGSFSKAANATGGTVFPDLGTGMWVLWTTNGTTHLCLDGVQFSSKGTEIAAGDPSTVTFVADMRPNITVGSTLARTINFAFYKMKVD